jgi:hypothetical protein
MKARLQRNQGFIRVVVLQCDQDKIEPHCIVARDSDVHYSTRGHHDAKPSELRDR